MMLAASTRRAALLLAVALPWTVTAEHSIAGRASADPHYLKSSFVNPPAAARPLVWWHWLNGNISKDGIRKDLEWMKRSGIAGFQTFDGNLATPQIVAERLVYMTPEWKDALRFAASEADRLGLEMAIASSPGWSETGGPWVLPQDGMKKIAWSETIIHGGRAFRGKLAQPPDTTGPFLDAAPREFMAPLTDVHELPRWYRDATVFAYRVPAGLRTLAVDASTAGKSLDGALLSDGSFISGVNVPRPSADKPTVVELTMDQPQPVRSITLFMRGAFQLFRPGIVLARLEASTDRSTWRKVADLAPSVAPTTLSFPTVEAAFFRVMLFVVGESGPVFGMSGAASGHDLAAFSAFKSSTDIELLELRLSTESRIDRWEAKAGFADFSRTYAPTVGLDPQEPGVASSEVVDLTARVDADGVLSWTPPPGTWRVVRMGGSLLGKTNHPASAEATGLEVDKLDRDAVRRYLDTYLDRYRDAAGSALLGQRGVQALLTDSTEVGAFNWTPRLLEHFQRLRGYDPRPWLPALTGAIVESRERSDAFLYDFRRTLGELHASEHYGTVAAVAHERGLKVYGESLEGGNGVGDDLDMRRYADIPMGAQWTYPADGQPEPHHEGDMRGAASVAHVYGRNIAAAESLTAASNPWAYAPADLRRVIDLIFASGINRPVIHTSVHVPRDDRQPGLSLWIFGQYFNRLDTWAEMARPWIDYIARTSVLLQAGRPVADVAYFYGEDGAVGAMFGTDLTADRPKRFAYDFVSAKAVLDDITVEQGDLVAPSGAHYRVLQLGRMTLPVLRRIAALAEQGATIVGNRPKESPSLDEQNAEYAALVQRLWPGGDVTPVGKGRVIAGRDVEKALGQIGVVPDFTLSASPPDSMLMFVHRRIADGDIYFVANRSKEPETFDAHFRVKGKAPEIWRADSATIKPASYRIEGGQTIVPLTMAAEESFFVVFRHDTTAMSRSVADETIRVIAEIDGAWNVAFQPDRGAPASITLASLGSLSEHAVPGIKYFSGIATYRKTIEAPRSHAPRKPLLLDLGTIGDVAEVWVNGRRAGTAWRPPYRVDIGAFMKRGRNQLEIRIANLWVNRLIGDAQPGARPITYTATPTYTADAPLRRSGLIGPVRMMVPGR